jgi:hypothetical protein
MDDMDVRQAIIYVPGLFHESEESIETVSRNIAASLDRAVESPCKFNLSPTEKVDYDGDTGYTARKVTIAKEQAKEETPLIDVYEIEYGHTLIDKFENRRARKSVRPNKAANL